MKEKEFLKSYNSNKYWKPSVAADVLLFVCDNLKDNSEIKVLLIKRGDFPYKNSWALPGGFLEQGETLYQTALRELKEETGLEDIEIKQLAVWDDPNRDPRDRIISLSFLGIARVQDLTLKAGDDASDAKIFSIGVTINNGLLELNLSNKDYDLNGLIKVDENDFIKSDIIKSEGLAFDHAKIIAYGWLYLFSCIKSDRIIMRNKRTVINDECIKSLIGKVRRDINEESK
ncbi:MAG: NUDIX domain-containing protein [Clostridia bacterium]